MPSSSQPGPRTPHPGRRSSVVGWIGRQDLEHRELDELARGAARSRDARRRVEEPEDALRTSFQRDRDRVIHSASFRRLQHKTQVLAAFEGDHVRTRLTHSLEVSQMARSVAGALRHNADLCEAVALAHDLGHPPFGHVGERALDALMQGHGGFRHNAQGLRIIDTLEDRRGEGLGLNLTRPTRVALLKGRVPDGFPVSDDITVPLDPGSVPREARIVDCCDRIAYLCHDLDDGLRVGALALDEVKKLDLWRRAAESADADRPSRIISETVSLLVHDLVRATTDDRVGHGETITVEAEQLLRFLRERFYQSRRVLDVMEEGQRQITAVFEHLVAHPEELSARARTRLEVDALERVVCDYVAGMTDRFLVRTAESVRR
jgi:dGTPase